MPTLATSPQIATAPWGGVGINCAIADAVEAANVLTLPLRGGGTEHLHLAEISPVANASRNSSSAFGT